LPGRVPLADGWRNFQWRFWGYRAPRSRLHGRDGGALVRPSGL